jgi:hypothetical protein
MNCFEWRNRAGDHLEGTLSPGARREADAHLAECSSCQESAERYRRMTQALANHRRSLLPIPLRKDPLASPLLKAQWKTLFRRSKAALPGAAPTWWMRTGIEGTGVALALLVALALAPRARTLYERAIERRLDAFPVADLDPTAGSGSSNGAPSPTRGKAESDGNPAGTGTREDFTGEYGEEEDTEASSGNSADDQAKVGASEIWRFNLKTDSPREVQPRVIQLLKSLGVPTTTPGLAGIEAPGGIQFDLLVDPSVIGPLRNGLRKLTPGAATGAAETAPTANAQFTWYKNKSKTRMAAGKTRIVIWLSQV